MAPKVTPKEIVDFFETLNVKADQWLLQKQQGKISEHESFSPSILSAQDVQWRIAAMRAEALGKKLQHQQYTATTTIAGEFASLSSVQSALTTAASAHFGPPPLYIVSGSNPLISGRYGVRSNATYYVPSLHVRLLRKQKEQAAYDNDLERSKADATAALIEQHKSEWYRLVSDNMRERGREYEIPNA